MFPILESLYIFGSPKPYGVGSSGLSTRDIPETAYNLNLNCSGNAKDESRNLEVDWKCVIAVSVSTRPRKLIGRMVSVEYSIGWDPLAEGRRYGGVSQEILQNQFGRGVVSYTVL
ncbi:hypothetical protein RDI58_000634 [Solanum bulbocastanum]|uniref:Uncharacterized protein n=1 Tax=Solanum bulbocastanum TaxID=147425 RepID=A0AAN8UAI3_SOLBU